MVYEESKNDLSERFSSIVSVFRPRHDDIISKSRNRFHGSQPRRHSNQPSCHVTSLVVTASSLVVTVTSLVKATSLAFTENSLVVTAASHVAKESRVTLPRLTWLTKVNS